MSSASLGLLDVEVEYRDEVSVDENTQIQLEIRMGYRTKQDPLTKWHELVSTTVNRELTCTIDSNKVTAIIPPLRFKSV